MKWMKERDLLIAQTMDFVQSVTGKRPDVESLKAPAPVTAAPKAELPVPPPLPVATVVEAPPAVAPAPAVAAPVVEPAAAATQPAFAKLDIRGDFQSEVRARVASFRAHQERFLREREEYCSATMDKVRAALSELPRSDK
ncbi:hypothetical protein ACFFWD_20990 [Bradyrhizobium erythrophlei]|uniref:hypothetical protein n=1 Tax=Bradyrhizobium erythrophlei TaxID=1437360 RepID=UPI0035EF8A1B